MKRLTVPLLAVLAILLTAASCVPNPNPTLDCHVGTKGIAASFSSATDLSTIQEQQPTPVLIQFSNEGASTSDVRYRLSYNPDFFKTTLASGWIDAGTVQGGEPWNKCQGTQQRTNLTITPYQLPIGSASFDQQLFVDLCYQYWTNLSTNVCVSPVTTEQNALTPNCVSADKLFSGGQGGPVGVTKVESPVVYTDQKTHEKMVRIAVHLRNYGNGDIVAPLDPGSGSATQAQAYDEACSLGDKSFKNYAMIKGFLGNDTLNCSSLPGPSGPAPKGKTFMRYDPSTIQTQNGGMQVLRDYYFQCTGPFSFSREISLPFNLNIAYFYRDDNAAKQDVTVKVI